MHFAAITNGKRVILPVGQLLLQNSIHKVIITIRNIAVEPEFCG